MMVPGKDLKRKRKRARITHTIGRRKRVKRKQRFPIKIRLIAGLSVLTLVCVAMAVVMAGPEANFEVSSLTLSSTEAKVGEQVTVSVTVKNTGDATGIHRVVLTIDGEEVDAREVTLVPSGAETVTFTITKDTEGTFTVGAGGLTENLKVTPIPAEFEISNLSFNPSEVEVGKPVVISATVKNVGELEGTYTVELRIDGATEATKDVTLAGGDTETVSFTVTKDTRGIYTIGVDGLQRALSVLMPATFELTNLTISPNEVNLGDSVEISATVKNKGDMRGAYTVTLRIDGATEATEDITLTGGATETVSFTVTKNEAKTYNVTVDGLAGSFTVKPFTGVSIDFEWKDHLGEKWTWSIDVEQWRYEYYQGLSHKAHALEDYLKFVIYEDGQIKSIADNLMEAYSDPEDAANYILTFVQTCFPYTPEDEEYWRYPVETLVDNGDCEDKAVLFASIMKAAGYDVALIIFEGHAMAGVVLWDEPKYGTQEYSHWFTSDGERYYTCETTAEGWRVGDLPIKYEGESAHVLVVK